MVLALLAGAVVELLRIRADLDGGREALSGLSLEELDGGLVATIDRAAGRLGRADATARNSPFLKAVALVPGASTQVDALRDMAGVAALLGAEARAAASAVDEDLERAGSDPPARLDLLDTVLVQLDRIEERVADIDVGATGALLAPLRDARRALVAELASVPERFDEARDQVRALSDLLRGPTRYLVLAANNAEMRGGAGMPLSGGVVTFSGGDVDFGDFEPLANRQIPAPVAVPAELARTYQQFRMGQSWLQTAVSPTFTTTAPIYAAMSAQFPTGPVDGVLEVDAVALRYLLEVIGPVEHAGITYTAENIEAEILNENYLRFAEADEREERREVQGEIAAAIFDAIKTRDVEIADLAISLREAALGRHLLAWSADPDVQAIWESVYATGELPEFGLMVTAQNIAANKLDWYIDPKVTVRATPKVAGGDWKVRLSVEMTNPERDRTSVGIESSRPEPEYRNGMHRVLLAVYLPKAAYDVATLDLPITESGRDGPMNMVGKRSFVAEGETVNLALEFSLPADHDGFLVLPSGRVRPVTYEVNGQVLDDAVPVGVTFSPPQAPGRPVAATALAILALGLAAAALVIAWSRGRFRPR